MNIPLKPQHIYINYGIILYMMTKTQQFKIIYVTAELHQFLKEQAVKYNCSRISLFVKLMAEGWGYDKNNPG